MRLLQYRKTNIVAYELIAAILVAITADKLFPETAGRHFIDSKPALGYILKGCSPQVDLNSLAGLLWFTSGARMLSYWGHYVPSKCNLADAPSRGDFQQMKRLNASRVSCDFTSLSKETAEWLESLGLSY